MAIRRNRPDMTPIHIDYSTASMYRPQRNLSLREIADTPQQVSAPPRRLIVELPPPGWGRHSISGSADL